MKRTLGQTADYATDPARWIRWGYQLAHRLWPRHPFLALLVSRWTRIVTAADIHPAAEIGRHVHFGHGVGVVIGHQAVIGAGCSIAQNVTIGIRNGDGMPHLGARVHVGANAVLLGPVTIGDDAKIGAGAVVLCDVPAGCTAVGNPARVLAPKGERQGVPHLDLR
jgi:serine O-acetyltransferase